MCVIVCQLQRWSHQSTIFHASLPTSVAIPQFSVTYSTRALSSEPSDCATTQHLFQYIAVAYRDGSVKLIDKQTFRPMTTTNLDTGISDVDNNAKRRRTIAYMTYMHQTITGKARLVLLYFGTAHMVLGAGFMQLSFFCPSVPSGRHMLLLQVCCCGPSSQEILIDCCMADRWVVSSSHATAWHTAANVGSARLSSPGSADLGS